VELEKNTNMTIAQYLPQWLQSRLQQAAAQKAKAPGKKDRQILPMVAKPERPPRAARDDDIPHRFRIYWRM
jgi:hypothetical protein